MQRRSLLIALAGLAASPLAGAQHRQGAARIGVMLMQPVNHPFPQAFRQGLRELGYVEGKNIQIEYRSAEGDVSRLAAIAAGFVQAKVDIIVAGGGTVGPRTAAHATQTIPIVFPVAADPVRNGIVQSLARPGGNATGLALLEAEINAKRLQLLQELVPKVRNVAVFADPGMGAHAEGVASAREAAFALGLKAHVLTPRTAEEFGAAVKAAVANGAEAAVVLASSAYSTQNKQLVAFAAQHRLVTVWEHRVFTDVGGLVSYGHDIADMYRNAARYVDRILKGAKPAELPVEQGAKLDLVINLKTAKDLRLTVPPALLVRAAHVIE